MRHTGSVLEFEKRNDNENILFRGKVRRKMNDLNNVVFSGNLTRNPNFLLRGNEEGDYIVGFTVAINQRYKEKKYANFVSCVIFTNKEYKDFLEKHLRKGKHVLIHGYLNNRMISSKCTLQVVVNRLCIDNIDLEIEQKTEEMK